MQVLTVPTDLASVGRMIPPGGITCSTDARSVGAGIF